MKKIPARKARHTRPAPSHPSTADARTQQPIAEPRSRPARRHCLAAHILAIPPGDASDEQDFARIQ